MILPLNQEELNKLPLDMLVRRMDSILLHTNRERYGDNLTDVWKVNLVSDIINTNQIMTFLDKVQKRIAWITFDYLAELELNSVTKCFANRILFTPDYNEITSWLSPTFRLREGAIRQYQIISNRIAMEIFMDLLHCVDTGRAGR
jgi:hypothetical protein